MLYIRILILLAVFMGYTALLNYKYHIRVEFAPAIISCVISVLMLFAGILNVFIPAVRLITVGGLVSFAYTVIKQKWPTKFTIRREYIIAFMWILILGYFAVLIRGSHFIHYDNFSHWAIIIKTMLINNRMPNFQDSLVMFQAYPLGSSLFIYYVCKIIGDTDACYIFGQIVLLVSFIFPLSSFVSKKNWSAGVIISAFSVYALISNISIYDLLVDTVMPLAGLSLFCIIKFESNSLDENRVNRLIFEIMPISIFLLQVKNSGVFFCLICWVYFFIRFKSFEIRNRRKIIVLLKFAFYDIVLPLVTTYLWKKHVQLVFGSGDTFKHAISLKNYKNIFGEKTPENIIDIGKKMIVKLTDIHNESFAPMLATTILVIVLIVLNWLIKEKRQAITHVKNLLAVYVIIATYVISVYLMYIFSMPLGEAVDLAGYERYMLTLDIFIFGMAIVFVLSDKAANNNLMVIMFFIISILPIWPIKNSIVSLVKRQDYSITTRGQLQKLLKDNGVAAEKSYLIYTNGNNGSPGYIYYLARFELWSNNVTTTASDDLNNYSDSWDSYDYIIMFTPDEFSNAWLEKNGFSDYANTEKTVISLQ
ncbi:hypothetical protein SAMN02745158_04395 [Lactonifactor longoviformis DSM 17459]|uniref:Dolichyl-phosphate-mannose-protein mannosyltransferase n=4 Tax=Lactonifactor TaxID=420345 RepID=A0A1M5D331_9CLOT|nr:hypothetical protein SAMN02745158_04395 [Lactonifactor longoviformis DSM 17459]